MNRMNHILVVDDHEENVYYLRALLAGHGFLVESARHGAEALIKARQNPPDLIISDLLMPVMDGYTLLRHWKADARLRRAPFIVYTATYTDPADERLAFSLGADAFILKPMEPEDFLARVREVQAAAAPPKMPSGDEKVLLEDYSHALIRKLEEKSLQLEEANRALRQDIEARKRVEEELRWKTTLLEAQMDSTLDGILVVDEQGKKVLQNQKMGELWNIPPEIAADQDDARQFQLAARRTKNPGEFINRVTALLAHPEEVNRGEIELLDGTILDRYSSPVRDKEGKYYGRIWTFRDITEHRKLETQYRQAQKMEAIGQLAGGVAHDFNNILAVILLQTSLLKSEDTTPQQRLEIVREIETAGQHAVNLTRQLLLFSRKQVPQMRDLDLNNVVTNLAKILQRFVGEDVRMQFQCAPQLLWIHADAGMLEQILMNLAVNARDAMPEGGRLVIEASAVEFDEVTAVRTPPARPGAFACLRVSDTGCGIEPENLPRIFEPFFTTKDVGKGTGLGLATVFGIVQQHQGWIKVDSQPGQGTTFRIYLPRLVQNQIPKAAANAPGAMPGGRETLLLVEDNATVRASLRITLSRMGYRILEAPNGVVALEIWKQYRPEIRLLLTDLVMPEGINGKALGEQMVREEPALKVVYLSGYSAEIIGGEEFFQEGVNFLTKPFEPLKLAQVVRDQLDDKPRPTV
jgi:signal transduction histidine kinase/DNA-binding NarL/FixJ family response regulator